MEELPMQLGVGGIFALLVLRLVFDAWNKWQETQNKRRGRTSPPPPAAFDHDARTQLQRLYEWHDQRDPDGVPMWYVRGDLRDAVKQLSRAVDLQTQILRQQTELLKEIHEETQKTRMTVRAIAPQPAKGSGP